VNHYRPSVDTLFLSAARILGPRVIGVLLSGMGTDGAQGLHALKQAGAFTIAQDEASSIIYGMPRAAVEIGAVARQVALDDIPALILEVNATRILPAEMNGD
jgi:two-component system chemotaxis response regulator CheB